MARIRVSFVCALTMALPAFAGAAAAADGDSGLYASFRALGAYSKLTDSSHSGTVSGTLRETGHDDLVAGTGLALGYSFAASGAPVRTELEFMHRFRFDYDARSGGASGTGFGTNIATQTVIANTYWDFMTSKRTRPFVGFGLGWYRHDAETKRTDLNTNITTSKDTTSSGLTWSLLGGVNYDISPLWGLELIYRYIDMGKVDVGPFSNGNKLTADYSSHDFVIGVNYRF